MSKPSTKTLTAYALDGYNGKSAEGVSSRAWFAHVVGTYMRQCGAMPPKKVAMDRRSSNKVVVNNGLQTGMVYTVSFSKEGYSVQRQA